MSKPLESQRMKRAKSEATRSRSSTDLTENLRSKFRNNYLDKIKHRRSKSADRFRKIVENYCESDNLSLSEFHQALLKEFEATCGDTEDMSEMLKEIEDELQQMSLVREVEEHVNERQEETEDAVERLMIPCSVCQNLSVDEICATCRVEIKSEFM